MPLSFSTVALLRESYTGEAHVELAHTPRKGYRLQLRQLFIAEKLSLYWLAILAFKLPLGTQLVTLTLSSFSLRHE
jgi:hypothetical protein